MKGPRKSRGFTKKRLPEFQAWWDRNSLKLGLAQPRYWIALAAFKAGQRSVRRELRES